MGKLSKNMVTLSRQGGGSFKTVADRMKLVERFALRLQSLNIQIRNFSNIKTRHIQLYIESRKAEKLNIRTLQNEMSAMRTLLRVSGKPKLADPQHEKLSNKALGISGSSRAGTKQAISDDVFHAIHNKVLAKDPGAAAIMELSRQLGLRTEEAIQSVKSLKTWQKAIIRGDEKVRVIFGTKGGRTRDTTILQRERLLEAVNNAIRIAAERNGKLIDKPALHLAIECYRNIVRDAGMSGKNAPHSLRYAYTRDVVDLHKERGFSQKEAEALASMDLGHGDGRGHYVARVYNRESEDE